MTCVLGVALVLISFGRHKTSRLERSNYRSTISASKPVETLPPAPSPRQALSNQAWHSTPTPTQPNRPEKYTAGQLPKRALSRTNQTVVENYFDSTPLNSSNSSRPAAQHPLAKRYAQKNQQRNPTLPTSNQTWPTWPTQKTNQYVNDGYIKQAVATIPASNSASDVHRADFESQSPKPDFSTRQQHNHGGASRLSVNRGIAAAPQKIASYPVTSEPSVSPSKSVLTLENEPVDSTPIRTDKRVRKANWAEIEVAPTLDISTAHRPLLLQLNLPKQNATPQVEAKARELVRYGQSLARRQAFFASRDCLLYTSPSPRDKRQSRMPSSA